MLDIFYLIVWCGLNELLITDELEWNYQPHLTLESQMSLESSY